MDGKMLVDALNGTDFKAFRCKSDPSKGPTLSFLGTDKKRYFLTRIQTDQTDGNNQIIWKWAVGNAMRDIGATQTQPSQPQV